MGGERETDKSRGIAEGRPAAAQRAAVRARPTAGQAFAEELDEARRGIGLAPLESFAAPAPTLVRERVTIARVPNPWGESYVTPGVSLVRDVDADGGPLSRDVTSSMPSGRRILEALQERQAAIAGERLSADARRPDVTLTTLREAFATIDAKNIRIPPEGPRSSART